MESKEKSLNDSIDQLTSSYRDANAADQAAVEAELEAASRQAEAEREASGEADEDHDNRKLKVNHRDYHSLNQIKSNQYNLNFALPFLSMQKADRMRMVMKNKEEGTELFKGTNWRPAAARYHKALTHAAKFFDLSPEDEKEVKFFSFYSYCSVSLLHNTPPTNQHISNLLTSQKIK